MTQSMKKKLVVVGDCLGNIEEYLPVDDNTVYEDEGKLYAAVNGYLEINPLKRTIKVKRAQRRGRPKIKVGDDVIAQVWTNRRYTVGVEICKVKDTILADSRFRANIHVSNVSKRYIERLDDAYRRTDWIRAKVTEVGMEYELTTEGHQYGVITAQCSVCGTHLERRGKDFLQCTFCGKREQRKIASDYGNVREKMRI